MFIRSYVITTKYKAFNKQNFCIGKTTKEIEDFLYSLDNIVYASSNYIYIEDKKLSKEQLKELKVKLNKLKVKSLTSILNFLKKEKYKCFYYQDDLVLDYDSGLNFFNKLDTSNLEFNNIKELKNFIFKKYSIDNKENKKQDILYKFINFETLIESIDHILKKNKSGYIKKLIISKTAKNIKTANMQITIGEKYLQTGKMKFDCKPLKILEREFIKTGIFDKATTSPGQLILFKIHDNDLINFNRKWDLSKNILYKNTIYQLNFSGDNNKLEKDNLRKIKNIFKIKDFYNIYNYNSEEKRKNIQIAETKQKYGFFNPHTNSFYFPNEDEGSSKNNKSSFHKNQKIINKKIQILKEDGLILKQAQLNFNKIIFNVFMINKVSKLNSIHNNKILNIIEKYNKLNLFKEDVENKNIIKLKNIVITNVFNKSNKQSFLLNIIENDSDLYYEDKKDLWDIFINKIKKQIKEYTTEYKKTITKNIEKNIARIDQHLDKKDLYFLYYGKIPNRNVKTFNRTFITKYNEEKKKDNIIIFKSVDRTFKPEDFFITFIRNEKTFIHEYFPENVAVTGLDVFNAITGYYEDTYSNKISTLYKNHLNNFIFYNNFFKYISKVHSENLSQIEMIKENSTRINTMSNILIKNKEDFLNFISSFAPKKKDNLLFNIIRTQSFFSYFKMKKNRSYNKKPLYIVKDIKQILRRLYNNKTEQKNMIKEKNNKTKTTNGIINYIRTNYFKNYVEGQRYKVIAHTLYFLKTAKDNAKTLEQKKIIDNIVEKLEYYIDISDYIEEHNTKSYKKMVSSIYY